MGTMIYVFILGIISGVTGQQVHVEPKVFAYPGQTVELLCALTGDTGIQLTQVTWFYQLENKQLVSIAVLIPNHEPSYPESPLMGRVSFSPSPPNMRSPSIQISNVSMTDEGKYTCQYFTFPAGTKQNVTFLDMLERLTNPSVTSSPKQPVAGNSINLTCEAAGSVFTRKWKKNGTDLNLTNNMILYNESRVLSFLSLKKTDNGVYSCDISNPLSSIKAEYIMVVNYGPENVQIKGPSEITLNKTLTLTCSAESTPSATYNWKVNKTEILSNSSVFIKKITDLSDSGKYTCEAMNNITGRTSSAVHELTVTLWPTDMPHRGLSAGAIIAIILSICLVAAGGAAGGYYIYKKKINKKPHPHNTEQEQNEYENPSVVYENVNRTQ